jgi:hypothetical protein
MRQQGDPHNPIEDFDTPLARKMLILVAVITAFCGLIFLLYVAILKCLSRPPRFVAPLPQNMELPVINAANL